MSPELDNKLCKTFPLLFADRRTSMKQTCMCWGFECGDGWYDIIYRASSRLEPLIRDYEGAYGKPRASQVKEKFGTLRFYLSHGTDEMFDIANAVEKESETICENCGKLGSLRDKGWYSTRCDVCYKKDVEETNAN